MGLLWRFFVLRSGGESMPAGFRLRCRVTNALKKVTNVVGNGTNGEVAVNFAPPLECGGGTLR